MMIQAMNYGRHKNQNFVIEKKSHCQFRETKIFHVSNAESLLFET
jgi:hypothetical protein